MANTKRNEEEALIALFKRLRNLIPGIPPTEEVGITPPQFNLLERVANFPGSSMREIAEGLNLTPPTVSVAVRRLEKKGFLLRKPDAQSVPDERRRGVIPTRGSFPPFDGKTLAVRPFRRGKNATHKPFGTCHSCCRNF